VGVGVVGRWWFVRCVPVRWFWLAGWFVRCGCCSVVGLGAVCLGCPVARPGSGLCRVVVVSGSCWPVWSVRVAGWLVPAGFGAGGVGAGVLFFFLGRCGCAELSSFRLSGPSRGLPDEVFQRYFDML
jgi:hypothetical protein